MKHLLAAIFSSVFFLILAFPSRAAAQSSIIPDQLIVKFKSGQSPQEIQNVVKKREARRESSFLGAIQNSVEDLTTKLRGDKTPEQKEVELKTVEKQTGTEKIESLLESKNIHLIETSGKLSGSALEKAYEKLPEVEYADPNYVAQGAVAPINDPYYQDLWGLQKTNTPAAWNITHGSQSVVVAVIDSGIDYTHPDLPTNIIHGQDFVSNDTDPMDEHGHGTHVSGIIGAVADNGVGVAGIDRQIKLMAVRVLDKYNQGSLSGMISGIYYAVDNGAKVINISIQGWGSCRDISSLQETINYARSKNVTTVVAAGNFSTDASNVWPASCDKVITVGAVGPSDESADYTDYGALVDIAAPGGNSTGGYCNNQTCILSTYISRQYTAMQGTSMATPHVAATSALMLSVNPSLTPDQIEQTIKDTADPIQTSRSIGGKRLNVYKAVLAASGQPISTPSPVVTPSPTPTPTEASPSATPTTASPSATLTPTPEFLPADINRDGCVGLADFERWKYLFVRNITPAGNPADINQDGVIDILDYNEWFKAMRTLPADKLCKP